MKRGMRSRRGGRTSARHSEHRGRWGRWPLDCGNDDDDEEEEEEEEEEAGSAKLAWLHMLSGLPASQQPRVQWQEAPPTQPPVTALGGAPYLTAHARVRSVRRAHFGKKRVSPRDSKDLGFVIYDLITIMI